MQVETQASQAAHVTAYPTPRPIAPLVSTAPLTAALVELLNQVSLPAALAEQISQCLEQLDTQINTQSQQIAQLRVESLTDTLTGLPNRRAYDEKLEAEWTRLMRTQQPLALISIDVDHFKQYNDRYGHDQGDLCLKQVADTLQQTVLRSADLACRIGGEEFMVVVPGATAKEALALAEKIRMHLQAKRLLHQQNRAGQGVVTLSVGVAQTVPTPDQTPDELYKAADQALYQAKQTGRNQVYLASSPAQDSAQDSAQVVLQVGASSDPSSLSNSGSLSNSSSLKIYQQPATKARLAQAALQQSRIVSAQSGIIKSGRFRSTLMTGRSRALCPTVDLSGAGSIR
jgi:diguanylate cyclase (GGDEF)-like protein